MDEDFDFASNVRHCGGCDQACQADNAETSCEAGQCVIGACLEGFGDVDAEDDDSPGCEYRCPRYPAVAENCNAISVVDLLGTGTACLVFSTPAPGDSRRPVTRCVAMSKARPARK